MGCSVTEMRCKEVINNADGCRLGYVNDVEIDVCNGKIVAIIIYGSSKFFGIFGRNPDIRICWEDICVIGEDTVLVKYCPPKEQICKPKRRGHMFDGWF